MTGQDLFLILVVASYAVFGVALFGVSTWQRLGR